MKMLLACLAGLVGAVVLIGAAGGGIASTTAGSGGALAPSSYARADIPQEYLRLYLAAAGTCPGLPWTVLAAIGKVETRHGQSGGVSSAGARGPMQFLPSTWARYGVDADGDGHATITNPADAIHAAATYLCASGARNGRDIRAAVYAYNHSRAYVDTVLSLAQRYGQPAAAAASGAARKVLAYARAQMGEPYVWGADGPNAFDCSGLTMRAYQAAGIDIGRTTYTQWDASPHIPRHALQPGDLVFFRMGPRGPEHVGLYLGDGNMINAPHSGAVVRVDPIDRPSYVGATRPAAGRGGQR